MQAYKKIIIFTMLLFLMPFVSSINFFADLNMGGRNIYNVTNMTASKYFGDGSSLTGVTGGSVNLSNISSDINMRLYNIYNASNINTTNLTIGTGSSNVSLNSSSTNMYLNAPQGSVLVNNQYLCMYNGSYCNISIYLGVSAPSPFLIWGGNGVFRQNMLDLFDSGSSNGNTIDLTFSFGSNTSATGLLYKQYMANISVVNSGQNGTSGSFMHLATKRNASDYNSGMTINPQGTVSINNTNPGSWNKLFVVDGNANISRELYVAGNMCFLGSSYPACSATYAGCFAYNATLGKHIGCNTTAWNALY